MLTETLKKEAIYVQNPDLVHTGARDRLKLLLKALTSLFP